MSKGIGIVTGKAGADEARYAARDASDQLRRSQSSAVAEQRPYSQYGQQALIPLSALLYGKNYDPVKGEFTGDVSEADRFNAFTQSPGYQYQLDQGLKAIERRNAATGTLLGGNTLKELQEYGSNLANQDYNNYINNLMGQANIGQNAATNISNIYSNLGSQIASYDYAGRMAKANQYNNMTNLLYTVAAGAAGAQFNPQQTQPNTQQSSGYSNSNYQSAGQGTYNSSYFNNAAMSSQPSSSYSLSSGGF